MKIDEMMTGTKVNCQLYLASVDLRTTKGVPPSNFLSMVLTDGTETIDGKVWRYNGTGVLPAVKKVYDIIGTIGDYNGKKQISIDSYTLAVPQDLTSFACMYGNNLVSDWNILQDFIESISNESMRLIVSDLYACNAEQIRLASSAKAVHHVGIGGNMAHTREVCMIADSLCAQLKAASKSVSRDLVIAGALLHDIGKICTYTSNEPSIEYTLAGSLHDHIVIGCNMLSDWFANACNTKPGNNNEYARIIMLLQHIIASHHGQLEYGSPVTPKFAEAYIVNYADQISASLDTLYAANDKAAAEGKEMTDKIFTLGNREHVLQSTVQKLLK